MRSAVEKTTVRKVSGLGWQGSGATQRPPPVSAGFGGLDKGNTAKWMTVKSLFLPDDVFYRNDEMRLAGSRWTARLNGQSMRFRRIDSPPP